MAKYYLTTDIYVIIEKIIEKKCTAIKYRMFRSILEPMEELDNNEKVHLTLKEQLVKV